MEINQINGNNGPDHSMMPPAIALFIILVLSLKIAEVLVQQREEARTANEQFVVAMQPLDLTDYTDSE